jgi:DNA-binding LytR/AlgR family response regulator
MASLSNWSLHSLTHRREIRSLASAFVGEIAAILHLIETHDVVSMLEKALDASDSAVALPRLTLPPFTIYTADAAKLDELPLPAPRKIAYFYAEIASIRTTLHGSRQSLCRKA